MHRIIKWVLVLVAIAAVVGGIIWFRQRETGDPAGEILRTAEVALRDLQLTVAASGNVAVKERADLLVTSPGTIVRVNVAANDRVTAGQILGKLETDDLERSVRQAEIALEQAQLDLETAEEAADPENLRLAKLAVDAAASALEVARLGVETARVDAEATLVQAQREREAAFIKYRDAPEGAQKDRALTAFEDAEAQERIAKINATLMQEQAQSQVQSALARYEQAQADLAALEEGTAPDRLEQLELQVQQAQLRLDQARRRLEDATIEAPFSAVVAAVKVEEGTRPRTGEPAFTLIDDSAYYVNVTIDEIDIGAVTVGQAATIILDAYPDRPVEAVVQRIAPASTELGGLVAYEVRLKLADVDDLRILDGMTATVEVVTETVADVLVVPNWAVRIDQESAEAYCYRVEEGEPQRTVVELGRRSEAYSEILSGLSPGDTVALIPDERDLLQAAPAGPGPFGN
ncbi:MAG: efflux RND transporter periplasmic adaptor subunit [Anaerolineae bacterium]